MKNFDGHATLMFGILVGLALGVVVGMWSPEIGRPLWIDPKCTGPSWYCVAYSWQTLLAGSFALVAAGAAWRSVQAQIAAEDRRELERKRVELWHTLRRFLQLQKWIRQIQRHSDVLARYQPEEDTPLEDANIDYFIGKALFDPLQVAEKQKEMMSIHSLMQLRYGNRQMEIFRDKMQELRAECGGTITYGKVADEHLEILQRASAGISERMAKLEYELDSDVEEIAWQIDQLDR